MRVFILLPFFVVLKKAFSSPPFLNRVEKKDGECKVTAPLDGVILARRKTPPGQSPKSYNGIRMQCTDNEGKDFGDFSLIRKTHDLSILGCPAGQHVVGYSNRKDVDPSAECNEKNECPPNEPLSGAEIICTKGSKKSDGDGKVCHKKLCGEEWEVFYKYTVRIRKFQQNKGDEITYTILGFELYSGRFSFYKPPRVNEDVWRTGTCDEADRLTTIILIKEKKDVPIPGLRRDVEGVEDVYRAAQFVCKSGKTTNFGDVPSDPSDGNYIFYTVSCSGEEIQEYSVYKYVALKAPREQNECPGDRPVSGVDVECPGGIQDGHHLGGQVCYTSGRNEIIRGAVNVHNYQLHEHSKKVTYIMDIKLEGE